jgi:hypothetical protein
LHRARWIANKWAEGVDEKVKWLCQGAVTDFKVKRRREDEFEFDFEFFSKSGPAAVNGG